MNFRALALGVTVGFLAALVPSCGKGTGGTGGGSGGSGNVGGGNGRLGRRNRWRNRRRWQLQLGHLRERLLQLEHLHPRDRGGAERDELWHRRPGVHHVSLRPGVQPGSLQRERGPAEDRPPVQRRR